MFRELEHDSPEAIERRRTLYLQVSHMCWLHLLMISPSLALAQAAPVGQPAPTSKYPKDFYAAYVRPSSCTRRRRRCRRR
ncbi:hypothetical protein C8Q73DRAFT_700807 [Cubamyces lactineus]|nr:hypothetical protein C8Q73DRAFT_700807 [Cubamyces lactineus]